MVKRKKSGGSLAAARLHKSQQQRKKILQKAGLVSQKKNKFEHQNSHLKSRDSELHEAKNDCIQMRNDRVFVSVAAFCDPWLRFTLESLFEQAHYPDRLVVGVVDQSFDSQQTWIRQHPRADQIRYVHLDPLHSRGVCWARSLVQSLYDNESYYLQIDSHTWFSKDWDKKLIHQIEQLEQFSNRPILSIYPPPFDFDAHNKPFKRLRDTNSIGFFEFKNIDKFTIENIVIRAKVAYQGLPDSNHFYAARGYYLSGGFLITKGRFVLDVPYDPLFYFHGEEQALALRAFTHGWDIFHGRYRDVPLYHLYKSSDTEYDSHHWRKDLESRREVKFHQRREKAIMRLHQLVQGELPEPYGLGRHRTLEEYKELSGIDYLNGVLKNPEKMKVFRSNF
ncbi:Glycosyltransferase (GlcNAc) [Ectothiorhodospira magna]|uniref:Glycosyltransferase (GlcNAc) n=1 Tax=Ectothiorhodospira magna TaxID=867345 RepID=A0A1H9BKK7_9GAMM|nr:GlcNAc-transferase family protein [Ectothiorhodospira magna]SEP89241.1 Glycosyltransferase (GlcNAc) [Ectothiorhodospira magna]